MRQELDALKASNNDSNTNTSKAKETPTNAPKQANKANGQSNINKSADNGSTNVGTVGSYEATFYTAFCDTGCTGVTATGVDVSNSIYHQGKRVIAVDPSVIPLGSTVRVELSGGQSFDAVAADTGGAIKGKKIDVLVASKDEARRLGRQTAKVTIK